MAKKRKSRTPQPVEEPQDQINEPQQEQTPIDDVIPEQNTENYEQEPEPEPEPNQQDNEEPEEDEEDEEEEEEEEENDQETTLNEVKTEEETEGLDDEPVEKLLEPFSKEQLVLLLKEAVLKHPEFIESVQKIADIDPAHRKIFVHGLGWDTTTEVLLNEYGKYGEVEDCKHVVDKVSGKSKGYAFILYKHRAGAQKAMKEPQKKIGNRVSSCQLASAGPVGANANSNTNAASGGGGAPGVSEYTQRKIFVSNVAAEIEPEKLLEYFSRFGEIEDGPLGLDKQTGKPRGFALFVYKSVESAKKALEEPHKIFEGHTLHCQKAVDGPKPNKPFFQQYGGGGGGGGGHHPSKKSKYSNSGGGGGGHGHGHGGHLMAPSGPSVGYNPAVPPALTPVLGQALTALLAGQGGGLGNLLGLGGHPQGMPPAGYGVQPGMQGGYPNPQGGQGGNRPQQGGAPYMGHGR